MAQAKRAAPRKTVNAANLESLGAARLAEILMSVADDEPAVKRRLRLELAVEVGAEDLAAEIGKRLATIEARRGRITWRKYKGFVQELDLQRAMIVGPLAGLDPKLALEALWRFLALANGVFARTADSKGEAEASFRAAAGAAGEIVARARPDPVLLADQVAAALEADREQVLDGLVPSIAPALTAPALGALRAELESALAGRPRGATQLRTALQAVLDAQGDVDAYVATLSSSELAHPAGAAAAAQRLLAAGRTQEALDVLSAATPSPKARAMGADGADAWEAVRLDALDAGGETELAQELRWQMFERRLNAAQLRAYLKRLADFDDVEALDRAIAHAQAFPRFNTALRFFVEWPAAAAAAQLVATRGGQIDVSEVEMLEAAARLLEARYPIAASLILRALAADILRWAKADRYKAAAHYGAELASLAVQVADWGEAETHEAFLARMGHYHRAVSLAG